MRYYLVAGEASGDLHGSLLADSLIKQDAHAEFRFIGGDLIAAAVGEPPFLHYSGMSFMGFAEVVLHLRTILRAMDKAYADITSWHPDAVVLIDYPGFNLRLAKRLKKAGLRNFYFISPKVWAWNVKRVLAIKRDIERMFVIFSFEVDFYRTWGMEVDYVGNPLMDSIALFKKGENRGDSSNRFPDRPVIRPVIALLPGSRRQEIERILPIMLEVVPLFPSYHFRIAKAPTFDARFYEPYLSSASVTLDERSTYALLEQSAAALVTSGTATLETALFGVPEVVLYKTGLINALIVRALIRIKYISLVNLIMGYEVVKELIQEDCTKEKISAELSRLLQETERSKTQLAYRALAEKVGGPGAAVRAAGLIYGYLKAS